jgi:ABC-type microcin C transport system permease subunit YejB
MRQGLRWLVITPGLIAAVGLGFGAAGAADKAKVDQATQQVQQGAKQIGQGNVGTGVKETAKGIGNTIVEGAKFSGQTIKEFFAGK